MKNIVISRSFLFGFLTTGFLFFAASPFASADESLLQINRSSVASMVYEHTAPGEWQQNSVSVSCPGDAKVIDCLGCRGNGCAPDVRMYSHNISTTDSPGFDKEYYLRIDNSKSCKLTVNAYFPPTDYKTNTVRDILNDSYSVQAICAEDTLANDDSSSVDVIDSPLQTMFYNHDSPGEWVLKNVSSSCPADTIMVNCLACHNKGCDPNIMLFNNDIYGPGMSDHNVQYSLHSDGQNTCSFQLNAYFSPDGYDNNIIRNAILGEYSVQAKCLQIESSNDLNVDFVDSPVSVMNYNNTTPDKWIGGEATATCPADYHAVQCLACRDKGCTTNILDVSLDMHDDDIIGQGVTEYITSRNSLSSCTLKLGASFPKEGYENNYYKNAHNQPHSVRAKCLNVTSATNGDDDDDDDDDPVVLSPSTQTITVGDTPTGIRASGGNGSYVYTLNAGNTGIVKSACPDGSNTPCQLSAARTEGTATITVVSGTETQTATIIVQPNGDDDDDDQPDAPDPIPPSPGCEVINRVINNLPKRFASALDIFGNNQTILNVFQCSANAVTFSAGKNDDDYYIWKQVYYSKDGKAWESDPLVLSGNNESEGWIIGQGTASAAFSDSEIKLINYVAMYYCVWQDPDWKCGCSNTECTGDSARNWSLQSFEGNEDFSGDDDDDDDDLPLSLSPLAQTIVVGNTPTPITVSGGSGTYSYVLTSGSTGIDKDTSCGDGSNTSCPLTVSTAEGTATITVTSGSETKTATITVQPSRTDSIDPPIGQSSNGSGGGAANGTVRNANGVEYRVVAPSGSGPHPLLMVYSGTERGAQMATNCNTIRSAFQPDMNDWVFAVIDGVVYNSDNGDAGAKVLDHVRSQYNIDNDRTYLLGESAGTRAALGLGLDKRQSYFAAYWANDVNANAVPVKTADDLGFRPYGNAGPGGRFDDANAIVDGMEAAGYRTPAPAPYDGAGAGQHGAQEQLLAAFEWFIGKTRADGVI